MVVCRLWVDHQFSGNLSKHSSCSTQRSIQQNPGSNPNGSNFGCYAIGSMHLQLHLQLRGLNSRRLSMVLMHGFWSSVDSTVLELLTVALLTVVLLTVVQEVVVGVPLSTWLLAVVLLQVVLQAVVPLSVVLLAVVLQIVVLHSAAPLSVELLEVVLHAAVLLAVESQS